MHTQKFYDQISYCYLLTFAKSNIQSLGCLQYLLLQSDHPFIYWADFYVLNFDENQCFQLDMIISQNQMSWGVPVMWWLMYETATLL